MYSHEKQEEATQREIEQAAITAQADMFITDLSDGEGRKGYEAFVGERGIKHSAGQRQRVAIAQALLKDAPILVLDEATSALDSESETAIQEKLELVMAGKTLIAIAHRLSTITMRDRIVVLDHGHIVEERQAGGAGDERRLVCRTLEAPDRWLHPKG